MDHFIMIMVTGLAIGLYVYKLRNPTIDKMMMLICGFGIVWLSFYFFVELGRSTTVWFSGKAGDANPLTAIMLGASIAVNMPTRKKKEVRNDQIAT